jgi:hypothetical protein
MIAGPRDHDAPILTITMAGIRSSHPWSPRSIERYDRVTAQLNVPKQPLHAIVL